MGLVYPVWLIKTGMAVDFLTMWYLDSSMLSESSCGMRLDTISSLSSASATNSFNFWSKVGCFCVTFFLRALLEFELASQDVVVAEPSVKSRVFLPAFFCEFFTSLWGSLSLPCYFIITFSQLRFFLGFVAKDDLAFAIAPDGSVIAIEPRNLRHSA